MGPHHTKVTCHAAGGGSNRRIIKYVAAILVIALTNWTSANEEEGDWCINDVGEEGICRPINQCPGFLAKLSIYHIVGPHTPGLCFHRHPEGAVACCIPEEKTTTIDYKKYFSPRFQQVSYPTTPPPIYDDAVFVPSTEKEPVPLRISERKCLEYKEEVDAEGGCVSPPRPASLIVGGYPARKGEYPNMVALGYLRSTIVRWECGGTLISHQFILTAAHCKRSYGGQLILARLGELYVEEMKWSALLRGTLTRIGSSGDHLIDNIIAHPDYKLDSSYNDIALVRLVEPIQKFNEIVRPACLNTRPEGIGIVEATGWGDTKDGGDGIKVRPLLQVELELFSNERCTVEYSAEIKTRRLSRGIDDSMLCGGDLDGGKDTCQGDSGGPLQVRNNDGCLHRVLGVTSQGKACGLTKVALYTKVSSYIPWIESIVWPEEKREG